MFPYQISFPDSDASPAVQQAIEGELQQLEKLYDRITSCQVHVRVPQKHKSTPVYQVNIHIEIPGKTLVVDREKEDDYSHADVYVAVRDAFDAMARQLEEISKQRTNSAQSRR